MEKTSAVTWHRDLPLRGPSSDSEVHRGYRQGYGQDTGILYKIKNNNHLLHHNCSIEGLTLHRWNITAICIIIKCHLRIFFLTSIYQIESLAVLPQASGRSFLTAVVLISLKKDPLCTQRKCEMYRKKFSLSATTVNPVT